MSLPYASLDYDEVDLTPYATKASPTFTGNALFTETLTSYGGGKINTVAVGDLGYGSVFAGIANNSLTQPNNYAILQSNAGQTLLNSSTGQTIGIRMNDVEFASLDATDTNPPTPLGIIRCNQFGFHTLPGVTNTTVDARIYFVELNGVASWWCRNSAGQGGLIDAEWFGQTFPSDDRLKFNETPIQNGMELVKQMNPMFYDQIDGLDSDPSTAERQCGFIADEIEKIAGLDFLVTEKPDSHYPDNRKFVKALRYNGIMTIAVQALKEVISLVEAQQNEIASLSDRVADLESKLA